MIHVAFNIDDNYVDKCKVVMKSILANTQEEVCFHVVGAEIEGSNIKCYEAPDLSEIKQKDFVCLECGHAENADVNAAKNILAEGQSVTARG